MLEQNVFDETLNVLRSFSLSPYDDNQFTDKAFRPRQTDERAPSEMAIANPQSVAEVFPK
jgi:hypothetical protein